MIGYTRTYSGGIIGWLKGVRDWGDQLVNTDQLYAYVKKNYGYTGVWPF